MGRFLTELDARDLDDTHWRLLAPLVFESAREGRLVVPTGFITDFSSVPRLPLVYWATGGTAEKAAVLHDWLYAAGVLPRRRADAVFREAMAVTGVVRWRRWIMWAGVRLFGASAWARDHAGRLP